MVSLIGFIVALVIGGALCVVGATHHPFSVRLFVWGIWAIVSTALAWIASATAQPAYTGDAFDQPTFGAEVSRVPDWAWYIIAGMFVVALVVGYLV